MQKNRVETIDLDRVIFDPEYRRAVIEALAASSASPKRSARDVLSAAAQGGPAGNLYTCRANGDKTDCSAASDPTKAGLASVIVGR